MIPNHEPNSLETSGAIIGEFGVSEEDEAHVLGILRDQVYSDKVLAVLREYTSNAWDANRSAGKGDVPVDVHLPTSVEPWFSVTDQGPGLSPEAVVKVYTRYGRSTKRNDPNQVGMLGIGSKSAFAYATSFTVTSRFGGKASTYVCALEASDLGTVALLSEEECGETTGVTVQVAVRPSDISAFRNTAADLYAHFSPTPACDVDVTPRSENAQVVKLDGGFEAWVEHNSYSPSMTAVMGCVPYEVDLNEIELPEEQAWAKHADIVVQFPIGAVQFVASREELRYVQSTKDAIVAALGEVTDKLVQSVLEAVESENTTPFLKRCKLLQVNQLNLLLPEEYEDLAKSKIQLVDRADEAIPFTLYHRGNTVGQVMITKELRFFLQDTPNKLSGYNLGESDYIVCPRDKKKESFEAAKTSFEGHIEACELKGVPIALLSTKTWHKPWNSHSHGTKTAGQARAYKADMLAINPDHFYGSNSEHWAPVRREPLDSDVYVELTKFEDANHDWDVYSAYRSAADCLKAIGETVPIVYGYKLGKGPARKGTEFHAWWTAKVKEVIARPDIKKGCIEYEARECLPILYGGGLTALVTALGEDHPIARPYVKAFAVTPPAFAQLWYSRSGLKTASAPSLKELTHALGHYPLLDKVDQLIYDGKRKDFVDYVKLVDEHDARMAEEAAKADPVPDIFADVA